MKSFNGRLAVVTGGSDGIGRELAVQLAADGCNLAICATSTDKLLETRRRCERAARQPVRITTHVVDVSDEMQMQRFRDELCEQHSATCIHLLISNAGIAGGDASSFVVGSREHWERVFAINWYGVYYSNRVFLPLLQKADEGHIVNVSSIAGFWATASSAYSTSKFAVKGFTESLITDLRQHSPHIKASVVIPGKVGTDLIAGSQKRLAGVVSPEVSAWSRQFADSAPTSATAAAQIILAGVRAQRWRILVGVDAEQLDRLVRATPDDAYDGDFAARVEAWR